MFFRGRKEAVHKPVTPLTPHESGEPERVLYDQASGLYKSWYIERRGREEVTRSARYDHPFALIIWEPRLLPNEALSEDIVARAGEVILSRIRNTDLGGRLNHDLFFAALLVEAGHDIARSVAYRMKVELGQRVRTASGAKPWRAGIAIFPEDGVEFDVLLHVAMRRLAEDVGAAA